MTTLVTLVETHVDRAPKHTAYERSKQAAEGAAEAVRARGLDVVYVNPSAVYGPTRVLVHTSLNQAFIRFLNGKVPLTPPGGLPVVYVDGCAEAHLAAMERGVSGERYLVADRHVTFRELLEEIARQAGGGRGAGARKVPPVAPAWLLKALAAVSAPVARAFGFAPLVAPGEQTFLLWNVRCDTSKAQAELGFVPQSFEERVAKTVAFLRAEKLVRAE